MNEALKGLDYKDEGCVDKVSAKLLETGLDRAKIDCKCIYIYMHLLRLHLLLMPAFHSEMCVLLTAILAYTQFLARET